MPRPKPEIHAVRFLVSLDLELLGRLDRRASDDTDRLGRKVSRNEVVKQAVEEFLANGGGKPAPVEIETAETAVPMEPVKPFWSNPKKH